MRLPTEEEKNQLRAAVCRRDTVGVRYFLSQYFPDVDFSSVVSTLSPGGRQFIETLK